MAHFELTVETDNAAFTGGKEMRDFELAIILRNVADMLENGYPTTILRDLNGNTVGSAEFVE